MNLGRVQRSRIAETNTFTKRPVFTQIIAYLIVLFELLVFTICVQANIADQAHQIILMVLYYSSFLVMVASWVVTSKTNPSDSLMHRDRAQINEQFPDRLLLYCQKCRKIVQQASLHCKICDTCVQNFDHHCIWINNCIGKKNYKVFIVMIVSVSVNFILFVTAAAILWSQGNWDNFRSSMITVWVTSAIVAIFTCLLLALVVFHVYLIATAKTTYRFFMQKKQTRVAPQHCTENLVIEAELNRNSVNQMKGNSFSKTQIGLAQSNHASFVGVENIIGLRQHERSISEQQQSKLKESSEKQSEKESSISIESKPSQARSEVSIIRKNKSIDYIIGRFCVDEQPRINHRSQLNYQSLKYHNVIPHSRKLNPLSIK